MTDRKETSTDIIAEMRGARTEFPFVYLIGEPDTPEVVDFKTKKIIEPRKINIRRVTVKELADRLDAAHKRERGDVAKLREAIAKCVNLITEFGNAEIVKTPLDVIIDIESILKAALSTPPRNCDLPEVAKDPWRAWLDDKSNWDEFGSPKLETHDWLLAPATEQEGGAK